MKNWLIEKSSEDLIRIGNGPKIKNWPPPQPIQQKSIFFI